MSSYTMKRNDTEYDRLNQQANVWESATRKLIETAGIKKGMRCLDVGCGTGAGMDVLCSYVGAHGEVTGIDIDQNLKEKTLERLRKKHETNVHFLCHDLMSDLEIPGGAYDFAYLRFILHHLKNPTKILSKVAKAMSPNGVVVLHDYDFRSIDIYPEIDIWKEFITVFCGSYKELGLDLHFGHKLPVFIESTHGIELKGTQSKAAILPLSDSYKMIASVYQGILPHALKFNLTTEDKAKSFLLEFEGIANSSQYHATFWPILVGSWGSISSKS